MSRMTEVSVIGVWQKWIKRKQSMFINGWEALGKPPDGLLELLKERCQPPGSFELRNWFEFLKRGSESV